MRDSISSVPSTPSIAITLPASAIAAANVELADRLADFETEPDVLHLPGSRALARNGTGTSQQTGRNLMRANNRDAMSLEQFHQA
ncbi:MAG: hypothetical protein R3D29_04770 [Nitratireductor sp.]